MWWFKKDRSRQWDQEELPLDTVVIDNDAMNAFATGRDRKHSVVVVTRGLLEKLNLNLWIMF